MLAVDLINQLNRAGLSVNGIVPINPRSTMSLPELPPPYEMNVAHALPVKHSLLYKRSGTGLMFEI